VGRRRSSWIACELLCVCGHYSRRTEKDVDWIRRYILCHQKKHPSTMGATEIVAFLSWLAVEKQVSASTQNQALSAVLFLYKEVLGLDIGPIEHVPRARMPDKLPVVLSRKEIGQLMKHVDGRRRAQDIRETMRRSGHIGVKSTGVVGAGWSLLPQSI